jgi:hypothetical protein
MGGDHAPSVIVDGAVAAARLFTRNDQRSFLAALAPADHLATFGWLFPDDWVPAGKRNIHLFMRGLLEEHAGDRAQALLTFETIRDALARDGTLRAGGSLPDGTRAAIARLSR